MSSLGSIQFEDRDEFIEMIAQAVIDKIEERERVNRLADLVVARVLALEQEEALLREGRASESTNNITK
jgi:hypothetical protein